jgi:pimeloyl-ACP methyl ester carboxylesterase
MEQHFISWEGSLFHYHQFGHGTELVCCFHGYGEEGSSFEAVANLLGDQYKFIAIDAPFHGKTDWSGGLFFEPKRLLALVNQLVGEETQISLFGYSMGGRMAMSLFQLMPHRVKQMVLVAPDGLHKNKWQWFSTQTLLGNKLFQYTMKNPSWILGLIGLANKTGLLNKSVSKFVHYYLDDPKQRADLYIRWTTNRRFRPDLGLMKLLIRKYQVPVQLIFGKHDRIIIAKRGIQFSKKNENLIQVTELDAGHLLMQKKHASTIADRFIQF